MSPPPQTNFSPQSRQSAFAADGGVPEDPVERGFQHGAAVERGDAAERGARVDAPVVIDAERLDPRVAEVELVPRRPVDPDSERVVVVDPHAARRRGLPRRPHLADQPVGLHEEVAPGVDGAPALVQPHEVHGLDAERLREGGELRQFVHVARRDDTRQREMRDAGRDQRPHSLHDPLKRPRAADRIVGRGGSAVAAHLQPEMGATRQGGQPLRIASRPVGQDGQPPPGGHPADQIVDVVAEERLTSRHEDFPDAETQRVVHDPRQHFRRKSFRTLGAACHEAVRAGQVAEVVHLQPQFAEAGPEVARPAGPGCPGEGGFGEEVGAAGVFEEGADVDPGFGRLEVPGLRVAAGQVGDGPVTVDPGEERGAAGIGGHPVRTLRIEEHAGAVAAELEEWGGVEDGRVTEHGGRFPGWRSWERLDAHCGPGRACGQGRLRPRAARRPCAESRYFGAAGEASDAATSQFTRNWYIA